MNEPPMVTTVKVSYPADAADRFLAYLRAGEPEKAILMLYEVGGMSAAELNLVKSLPSWHVRIAAASTIPREVLSVSSYSFDPSRFRTLTTPVVLLLGRDTHPVYKAATETLQSTLPHSRLVVLSGQGHDAVVTAPELYLREILPFLLG